MSFGPGDDDVVVDPTMKAFRPRHEGQDVRGLIAAGTTLADLALPLVTLSARQVEANLRTMAQWVAAQGVELQPHGKTTMAPALWRAQLAHGATGITVATPWQLRVAAGAGVTAIQHAGAIVDPAALADLARLLDARPELEVVVWADSVRTVRLLAAGYRAASRPLPVLVECGAPGSRTGARTAATALEVAREIAADARLELRGVAAWEGAVPAAAEPGSGDPVADFCDIVVAVFEEIEQAGLFAAGAVPVITAGGSAHFDVVAARFGPLAAGPAPRARVVLRSGCYVTHDDGYYARRSPLAASGGLEPALHVWAQVVSRPERELVVLDVGRRDVSFDQDLPVLLGLRGADAEQTREAIAGAVVTGLDDQHARVAVPAGSTLAVGDVVRLGISHPCTTFDKWRVIPVVDDALAAVPRLVGAVRTVF